MDRKDTPTLHCTALSLRQFWGNLNIVKLAEEVIYYFLPLSNKSITTLSNKNMFLRVINEPTLLLKPLCFFLCNQSYIFLYTIFYHLSPHKRVFALLEDCHHICIKRILNSKSCIYTFFVSEKVRGIE